MSNKKKKPAADSLSHLPDISDTVSATDFTGMIPSMPQDENELLAYYDLGASGLESK